MKVNFHKPYLTGNEIKYVNNAILGRKISGDGEYTEKVHQFFEKRYKVKKALMTTSATAALEFAVRLLNLKQGDEVIVPSFTFSSTVNAILLCNGARAVFADVDPRTLNIDPADIERKITEKTKALMIVHYAGVSCDMGKIMKIAEKYNLKVIEDAAQAIDAKYKNKYLGTIGDFGVISFHETKNIVCGEGGVLFINTKDAKVYEEAEIMREKGTNRSQFIRGIVDKYTWMSLGSSYLPSDILSAYLFAQLEQLEKIMKLRMDVYKKYHKAFLAFEKSGFINLPFIPEYATHNAHIFYMIFKSNNDRNFVMDYLRQNGVGAAFHYIPLHSAPHGKSLGYREEDLPKTERLAHSLLRLPIFSGMSRGEVRHVINKTTEALSLLDKERYNGKGKTRITGDSLLSYLKGYISQ